MRSRIICTFCALVGIGIIRALTRPVPPLAAGPAGGMDVDGSFSHLLARAAITASRLSEIAWRLDLACLIGLAVLALLAARLLLDRLHDSAAAG